jgi:hypothetical protein
MRQQMSQKQVNQKSAQAKDRLSITNSVGANQNPSLGNAENSSLARLFATQKSVPVDVGVGVNTNNEIETNNEKRGRFNLVRLNQLDPNLNVDDKSIGKKSMIDNDDEVCVLTNKYKNQIKLTSLPKKSLNLYLK